MNIDLHNHFYPKLYLDELSKGKGYAKVDKDEKGRLLIHYEGDYNIVVGSHIDIADRLKAMDRYGIDMHVLTLTTPSVERETPERGIKLARLANDGFSEVIENHPDRFHAFAALPLQAPDVAAEELERAIKDLGLKGGTLMTNVDGKPLDIELEVVFQKATKLNVPLLVSRKSPFIGFFSSSKNFNLI